MVATQGGLVASPASSGSAELGFSFSRTEVHACRFRRPQLSFSRLYRRIQQLTLCTMIAAATPDSALHDL